MNYINIFANNTVDNRQIFLTLNRKRAKNRKIAHMKYI